MRRVGIKLRTDKSSMQTCFTPCAMFCGGQKKYECILILCTVMILQVCKTANCGLWVNRSLERMLAWSHKVTVLCVYVAM